MFHLIIPAFAAFMLAPGRVAFHAVLEIGNSLFQMFALDARLAMFMAAIAGVRAIAGRVAGFT